MKFEELNIEKEIVRALSENNIKEPTLIQQKAIPVIKQGKDIIGISKTGSGKTIAFGIPILEQIKDKTLQTLIIAPTRELAVQISDELQKFSKYKKCSIATIFGGVSINPQIQKISKSQIVVGTPGRLIDHLQRRTMDLSKIKSVILDEADKMVEMGFIEDIERILSHTPKKKQILLFGATISKEIDKIKKKHMITPEKIKAETQVKEDFLKQYYYNITQNNKFSLLVHLMNNEKMKRAIIFCSTRATVETLTKNLNKNGVKASMIHGKLSQNFRMKTIKDFHNGKSKVLVASAVAARGIDIKDVSHVFNYDLSQDPQEYIHRVGRTARAGESGKAITLLSPRNYDAFREITSRYKVDIKKLECKEFKRLFFDTGNFRKKSFGNRKSFGNKKHFPKQRKSNSSIDRYQCPF